MFKYILGLLLVAVTACSENEPDFSTLSIYEQATHNKKRFKGDQKRDKQRKPAQVLEFAQVAPGMKVIDLLSGGGYYAELLNYIVGDRGKVIVQNNRLFLKFSGEELTKRLKGNRLENVIRLDSEFADMKLPEQVDLIVMGLNYHDIYVPREDPVIMTSREEFFPQIVEALKPNGRLLVIDHAAERGTGKASAATLHRIDEDFAKEDIEQAGFKFLGSLDVLRNPNDDYSKNIWAEGIMRNTDRFVYLFEKAQ